ncbi:MAG: hypothetical protein K2H01_09960, partial [Ruminococcus sp.]|nr:hypothetical protein [Ruminococcus sp.]
ALNYGLPCLVTPGSNMYEEIKDSDAGWTCNTTAESIIKSLRRVLKEKNKLKEKGLNAKNLGQKYDWFQLAQLFHDSIQALLSPTDTN